MNGIRELYLKEVREKGIIFSILGTDTLYSWLKVWSSITELNMRRHFLRDGIWNFLDSKGCKMHKIKGRREEKKEEEKERDLFYMIGWRK